MILGNPCPLGFTPIPGRSKSLQKLVSERGQASRLEWQKLVACLPADTVSGEHPENQKSPWAPTPRAAWGAFHFPGY